MGIPASTVWTFSVVDLFNSFCIFGIWGSFGTSNIFAVSASINPLGGHIVSLVAVMALVALLALAALFP